MKHLLRNSVYSLAETGWAAISLFFLFRFVASHLGVGAIGAWSLLVATMSISSIADVGVGRALLHYVPGAIANDRLPDAARYVETAATTVAVLFLAVLLIAAPCLLWVIRYYIAPDQQAVASRILPYALLSLWMSNVALVYMSGLAGMQRYDLRSLIAMAGSTTQLLVAVVMIRHAGLLGLVWAQLAQNIVILAGAALTLKVVLPQLSGIPVRFSQSHFKSMRVYGTSLQLYTFATFFFEPSTKIMMSHFGGLAMLGFYEMASRVATQFRTLVVNAMQVLIPALAQLHQQDKGRALQAYLRMSDMTWVIGCPVMTAAAIMLPAISILWLGHESAEFDRFALWVLAAWAVNLASVPAFFMGLASGYLKWNLRGMLLSSLLNLSLGVALGYYFGALGVVLAFSASLAIGSVVIGLFNHKEFGGVLRQMVNGSTVAILSVSICAVVLGHALFRYLLQRWGFLLSAGALSLVVVVEFGSCWAISPATSGFFNLLRIRLQAFRA